jgi:hypothetical protein
MTGKKNKSNNSKGDSGSFAALRMTNMAVVR